MLVLASKSPRRRELMSLYTEDCEIAVAEGKEVVVLLYPARFLLIQTAQVVHLQTVHLLIVHLFKGIELAPLLFIFELVGGIVDGGTFLGIGQKAAFYQYSGTL